MHDVLEPIRSLLRKSEKAQQKLAERTWQYAMMRDYVAALRIAEAALTKDVGEERPTPEELQFAAIRLDYIIGRSETAKAKFKPGTPQYTLQENRIRALRTALDNLQKLLEPG